MTFCFCFDRSLLDDFSKGSKDAAEAVSSLVLLLLLVLSSFMDAAQLAKLFETAAAGSSFFCFFFLALVEIPPDETFLLRFPFFRPYSAKEEEDEFWKDGEKASLLMDRRDAVMRARLLYFMISIVYTIDESEYMFMFL